MLKPGLYEQVLSKALSKELVKDRDKIAELVPIDEAEASAILSKYIAEIIEDKLSQIKGDSGDRLQNQIKFVNEIVNLIVGDDLSVDKRAEMLVALINKQNNLPASDIKLRAPRPVTSIAQSSLFTGALHEPAMYTELKKEIISSDRIDMLVSFIKWSGLRLIIEELRDFVLRGGRLRIITTSYMGATDLKAIEELRQLTNTEIKISYNTKLTRLHAKTYVFYRNTGFSTAYIGSSNLSNAAISSGLEWNMKITAKDQPHTMKKIDATFQSYWNSSEFADYTEGQRIILEKALKKERMGNYVEEFRFSFDINPYPYQQEILDKLEAEREVRGYYRNLVVAATGTGKTVISALDYKRFCQSNRNRPNRLLFVAHREEILKQSLECFRGVLKDLNFGELFVGNYRPESIEFLFISIQTCNSQEFYANTTRDYYDYIVVDEFHHAAAPSYQKLLTYYEPVILLGLTATPERMDGQSVTQYFGNRIAAEIRLPEAIDRRLLCPFQYFGVTDTVNLEDVKWTRGGYEKAALSQIYTGNDFRANMIIKALVKYVSDLNDVKGLGFCVSKEHAEYMSLVFNSKGITSICLTSDSVANERNNAKKRLERGEINFIFVVDIYNEGVDIPEVNTILFLRPTESLTVFLQQLGRGLRLADGKECLTVLDFVGQANKKYSFETKFKALLSDPSKEIQREIKEGFPLLPKGCYIQLEKKAKDYILSNIRAALGSSSCIVARISTFTEDSGKSLSLENFLEYYQMDVRNIYSKNSFSRLCVLAGVKASFDEELEKILTKAMAKICAINSRRWIKFLLKALPNLEGLDPSEEEFRMLNMLQYTIFNEGSEDVVRSLARLNKNPVLLSEIIEILEYNYNKIDFVDHRVDLGFSCPLDVHCTYTRDQILVAMDFFRPNTVREGVKYLPDKNVDLLFVTLNKADKDYSPTTMYNDYSINEHLFHWQSQSTTSPESTTGQRYINHKAKGTKILLFVREFKKDTAGTAPYTFLGLCDFVQTEGSKPMNIIWKLQKEIPAKYRKKTSKLVVG